MFVADCLPIESPFSITHTSIKKYQTSCPRKKYDRLSDCGAPWRVVLCVLVRVGGIISSAAARERDVE